MIVLKFCPKVNRPTLQLGTAVLEFAAVRIINMCKYLNERKKEKPHFSKIVFPYGFHAIAFRLFGLFQRWFIFKCKQRRCSVASNSGKRWEKRKVLHTKFKLQPKRHVRDPRVNFHAESRIAWVNDTIGVRLLSSRSCEEPRRYQMTTRWASC